MTQRATKCRSCPASIFWARTTNGRRIPVDVEPTPDGNLELTGATSSEGMPVVRVMPAAALATPSMALDVEPTVRYTPHFATCPNAADWRRR